MHLLWLGKAVPANGTPWRNSLAGILVGFSWHQDSKGEGSTLDDCCPVRLAAGTKRDEDRSRDRQTVKMGRYGREKAVPSPPLDTAEGSSGSSSVESKSKAITGARAVPGGDLAAQTLPTLLSTWLCVRIAASAWGR